MELSNPNLVLLAHLRSHLVRGNSLRGVLREFIKSHASNLTLELTTLLVQKEQNREMYDLGHSLSLERTLIFDLLWSGLSGQPILSPLSELEKDLEQASWEHLEAFLATLPFRALLVVMFFHVPALLILAALPLFKMIEEVLK